MTGTFQDLSLEARIKNLLHRIANVLLLNAGFIENPGLLNGKMGIALFFCHYAKYSQNKIFENYAGELIDEIYEGIDSEINDIRYFREVFKEKKDVNIKVNTVN